MPTRTKVIRSVSFDCGALHAFNQKHWRAGPIVIYPWYPRKRENNSRMRSNGILAFAMCLAISSCLQAKQLALVTNKAGSITNLTGAEFSKIINLKSHAWPDGTPLIIVMRDPSTPEMELLLHRVLNMTPEQAQVFVQTHKTSIVIVDSDEAVLRFVS